MSLHIKACLRNFTIFLAIILFTVGLFSAIMWFSLPSVDSPFEFAPIPSSYVLDRNGVLFYEIMDPSSGANRQVELSLVPELLQQAVIATEDASFYTNPGFDVRGVLRAVWINLQSGHIASGASTIAQQVARNSLMRSEERYDQTIVRKLREVMLAIRLSQRYEKSEILALYLNNSYFGSMAYGVEAASWRYFGCPVEQLDLAQCALIAGLLQAPSLYDPLLYPEAASERQQVVLGLMESAGYITSEEARSAASEELEYASADFDIAAPHFSLEAMGQVAELFPEELRQGGIIIETTLDTGLQTRVEEIVERQITALNRSSTEAPGHDVSSAAVVVMSVPDGDILALVGSPDFFDESISGAVNGARALRQPGSAIKPFTYAAAFERGYSPASVICDVPVTFVTDDGQSYAPRNYDLEFHGPISLRTALACSYNVVAVRLLDQIGVQALSEISSRLGIEAMQDGNAAGLSLTLGSVEVTLLDLVQAYGAFASGGMKVEPRSVERVMSGEGVELQESSFGIPERVLSASVASLVTDILADEVARRPAFGLNSVLETPFGAAVKTGTTTDFRDNWTIGYSSDYVVGVWVGNADGTAMRHVSGVDGAAPIWHDVMLAVHSEPPKPFVMDPSLVEVQVCPGSGLLPGSACPNTVSEWFLPENVPASVCDMHRTVEIDAATGLRADENTPVSRIVSRRITIWPVEAQPWAYERGLVELSDQMAVETRADDLLKIIYPAPGAMYCLSDDMPADDQRIRVQVLSGANKDVQLFCDDEPLASWAGPPYVAAWHLKQGEHRFMAISGDIEDSVSITVLETCTGERIAQ